MDDCLKYQSSCINNDRNPKWNDKQIFDIVADKSIVRLHVYDSDSHDNSTLIDPIGFVEFCIADIPFDKAPKLLLNQITSFVLHVVLCFSSS